MGDNKLSGLHELWKNCWILIEQGQSRDLEEKLVWFD